MLVLWLDNFNLIFRNGIEAALTKWLTAEKTDEGEFCPDNDTIKAVGFFGILGAGRGEATGKGIAK